MDRKGFIRLLIIGLALSAIAAFIIFWVGGGTRTFCINNNACPVDVKNIQFACMHSDGKAASFFSPGRCYITTPLAN